MSGFTYKKEACYEEDIIQNIKYYVSASNDKWDIFISS